MTEVTSWQEKLALECTDEEYQRFGENLMEKPRQSRSSMKRLVTLVFRSSYGKELLEEMEKEYDGDEVMADTPPKTYFNLGRRSVVRDIHFFLEHGGEE